MPSCANCGTATDYSNSTEHPTPFQNRWLCDKCVEDLGGYQTHDAQIAKAAVQAYIASLGKKVA